MKIAFDISPLQSGHKGRGIGFYTERLLSELKIRTDIEVYPFSNIAEVKNVDIVHYPYFDLFRHTLPIIKKFPTIVTIHDLIPLLFPEHYPPGIKGLINIQLQKIALKSCTGIITDSFSSQQDIVNIFGVPIRKITSIYLAPSEAFQKINDQITLKDVIKKYNLPNKFALYTGNVNWNKNLLNLAEACKRSNINLVLVGKDFKNRENLNHIELNSFKQFLQLYENDPHIQMLGYVPTEDLVGIMNLAIVGLLPSFYEGFGLPILEMQACGLPVITSNVSSMPEVAGKGAIFVDPKNVEDVIDAISTLLKDQSLKDKLISEGFNNSKIFFWTKVAEETINTYDRVLWKK